METFEKTVDNNNRYIFIGSSLGFLLYTFSLVSAGNIMFRKDDEGNYRFRLLGSLKQGITRPFFRSAPSTEHTIKFFFRADNPWFTIPSGAIMGYLYSKYY